MTRPADARHPELLRRFADDDADPPRAVLFAAHPDDETIGAAARLPHLRPHLLIVHVTDGSPRRPGDALAAGATSRRHYAAIRRSELLAALAHVGVTAAQLRQLPFTDQEASLHLPALVEAAANILREIRPDAVLTHPYEGGHPDHDATAFAVHAAVTRLADPPAIFEMTSYHNGPAGITPGEFLPDDSRPPITLRLAPAALPVKRRMLACFASQQATLQYFTGVAHERFRLAPRYDFTRPPHDGPLFYDQHDWGLRSDRWRELASIALQQLSPGIAG